MNYLTNYYKNLCEQLQEKINMLEAEIYGPEGKFLKGMEKMQTVNPYMQGEKRKEDLEKMKAALEDESHPIHQNPEDVAAVQRVVADAEKIGVKTPGSQIAADIQAHAIGEKEHPSAYSPMGWAKNAPKYGYAGAKELRTAVDVMRGTYGQKASQEAKPAGDHVTPSQY